MSDQAISDSDTHDSESGERALRSIGRFDLRRRLGEGAMGVVYEALDRERGDVVAVKMMSRVDPSSLYLFKQEFRGLADIVHPNLVGLHELVSVDGEWLLAMELISGASFLAFLRGRNARDDGVMITEPAEAMASTVLPSAFQRTDLSPRPSDLTLEDGPPSSVIESMRPAPGAPTRRVYVDVARARGALAQLARGLGHLHAAGKLHRDIKPSNVLVTREGRTVLLDFGLVTDLRRADDVTLLAGTPGYMAPEHVADQPLGPAADWYAVGAMLYEALTDTLPLLVTGEPWQQTLRRRKLFDPPEPAALVSQPDPDLSRIAMGLLRRDPADRWGGREVLLALGEGSGFPSTPPRELADGAQPALRGRARHLSALASAFASSRAGRATVVYVRGPSGMGKSALVRQFTGDLTRRDEAVVLEGRCYERESVPYKALDSLVDALRRHLATLGSREVEALCPRHAGALARLFPVLHAVPAIAAASSQSAHTADPVLLRRRGAAALRELVSRMADRRPVVLWIDDLQWGDREGAEMLAELIAPPAPPGVLLVVSYRDDDPRADGALARLPSRSAGDDTVVDLPVEPLGEDDAISLVLAGLGRDTGAARALAATIARESRGSPFFLHEFVTAVQESGASTSDLSMGHRGTLDDVLAARIARLPEDARRLLEVVSVAGAPIDLATARRAAELPAGDHTAIAALRSGNLVRVRVLGAGHEEVEPFHDRVRETVARGLGPELSPQRHLAVAEALAAKGQADPEILADLFRIGGDAPRSSEYALSAADAAGAALAFERAARFYRLALDQGAAARARGDILAKLGDALANAGRCKDAAEAFEEAAQHAGADAALDLRRRAGEQLLSGGYIDRGVELLGAVLDSLGLRMPRTPLRALLTIVLFRLWLRVRGLSHVERAEADLPDEVRRRIDLCFAAAIGLAMVDNLRGAYFQTLNLVLSLRAGEPYRLARALAAEIGYRASHGKKGRKGAEALVPLARDLAGRVGRPHTSGLTKMTEGMVFYLNGEWREGHDLIVQGEAVLRERCEGVLSERVNAVLYALRCLLYMGEIARVRAELPAYLAEATDRGNLFFSSYLRLRYEYLVHLAADDTRAALGSVTAGLHPVVEKRGFHIQHYLDVFAKGEIDLYSGDPRSAFDRIEERMALIRTVMLLRVQNMRVELSFLRGKAAAAAAAARPADREREALLRAARAEARKLRREGLPWADALSAVLEGALDLARGDAQRSRASLKAAASDFDRAGMLLHAAAARRALGLLRGTAGAALVRGADKAAADQGIVDPVRWSAMVTGDWIDRDGGFGRALVTPARVP